VSENELPFDLVVPPKYDQTETPQSPSPSDEIPVVGIPEGFSDGARGSNAWVISGDKTETKKPILHVDSHMNFLLPTIWYQVRFRLADKYNIAGASIPGIP
jgi:penicillin amidase